MKKRAKYTIYKANDKYKAFLSLCLLLFILFLSLFTEKVTKEVKINRQSTIEYQQNNKTRG